MCGTKRVKMVSRYFFHLMDESDLLRDSLGVEVHQLVEVESAAIDIIREYRVQEAEREHELRNWKLAVTDEDGAIVLLLPLFASRS
jgi:hypothetical protein